MSNRCVISKPSYTQAIHRNRLRRVIKQPPLLCWNKGGYKEIVAISASIFLLYRIHTIMSRWFSFLCFYYVVDIRLCQRCFISKSSYTPSYLTPFYPEHLKSRCAKPRFYPLRSLNNPTRFLSVMPFLLRFFIVLWIIVANSQEKRRQKIVSSFSLGLFTTI